MLTSDERWDLDLLRNATRYQRWVVQAFGPHLRGRTVEVGAGIGNYTREIAARVDELVALEPAQDLQSEILGLGLANVRAVPRSIESSGLAGGSFDGAVLINVLEHVDDEVSALRHTLDLLRLRGHVFVMVPAHPALFGVLDARYEHIRRYRKREVAERLLQAGFEDVRVRYFNPLGAVGWLVVGKVLRPDRLSRWTVTLSERVAVPAGRALERLGSPPFGQSVIGVARRPARGDEPSR